MNTIVASPIAKHKLYSLDLWASATDGHPRVMSIENADEEIAPAIEALGIPVVRYEPPEEDQLYMFHHRFTPKKYNEAYRVIIDYAEKGGYDHVLSLQSDNIPPDDCDIVQVMEDNWDGDVDFLIHLNPWRDEYGRPGMKGYEMGCTLASTKTWRKALDTMPPTGVLYWAVYQTKENNPRFYFTHKRIDVVDLKHLES